MQYEENHDFKIKYDGEKADIIGHKLKVKAFLDWVLIKVFFSKEYHFAVCVGKQIKND